MNPLGFKFQASFGPPLLVQRSPRDQLIGPWLHQEHGSFKSKQLDWILVGPARVGRHGHTCLRSGQYISIVCDSCTCFSLSLFVSFSLSKRHTYRQHWHLSPKFLSTSGCI